MELPYVELETQVKLQEAQGAAFFAGGHRTKVLGTGLVNFIERLRLSVYCGYREISRAYQTNLN